MGYTRDDVLTCDCCVILSGVIDLEAVGKCVQAKEGKGEYFMFQMFLSHFPELMSEPCLLCSRIGNGGNV